MCHVQRKILQVQYNKLIMYFKITRKILSINFMAIPEVRVRFPALPDYLRSSGSGAGSTQPREYN
jgi:hypothetical protein